MTAYKVKVTIEPKAIAELIKPHDGSESWVLIQTTDCSSPVYVGSKECQPYKLEPNKDKLFHAKVRELFIKGDGIDKVAILVG